MCASSRYRFACAAYAFINSYGAVENSVYMHSGDGMSKIPQNDNDQTYIFGCCCSQGNFSSNMANDFRHWLGVLILHTGFLMNEPTLCAGARK